MKKTIIVLLTLAGLGNAATVSLTDITDQGGAYTLPTTWTEKGVTLSFVCNVDTLQALTSNLNNHKGTLDIITATDAANHVYGVMLGDTSAASTIFTTSLGGANRGSWTAVNVNWSNVTDAAITVSFYNAVNNTDDGSGVRITFTFVENGEVTHYERNDSALMYYNGGDIKSITYRPDYTWEDLNGVEQTENLFTSVYAVDGVKYGDAAKALNKQILNIPEPTTATLSLLALAGLAARRRRK